MGADLFSVFIYTSHFRDILYELMTTNSAAAFFAVKRLATVL